MGRFRPVLAARLSNSVCIERSRDAPRAGRYVDGCLDFARHERKEILILTDRLRSLPLLHFVIPAKAGTQSGVSRRTLWVPAFAGMTNIGNDSNPPRTDKHKKPAGTSAPAGFNEPRMPYSARVGMPSINV